MGRSEYPDAKYGIWGRVRCTLFGEEFFVRHDFKNNDKTSWFLIVEKTTDSEIRWTTNVVPIGQAVMRGEKKDVLHEVFADFFIHWTQTR